MGSNQLSKTTYLGDYGFVILAEASTVSDRFLVPFQEKHSFLVLPRLHFVAGTDSFG